MGCDFGFAVCIGFVVRSGCAFLFSFWVGIIVFLAMLVLSVPVAFVHGFVIVALWFVTCGFAFLWCGFCG